MTCNIDKGVETIVYTLQTNSDAGTEGKTQKDNIYSDFA